MITLILGAILGVARLSSNWLVAKIAAIYIEVMQDIPVLLQLFFWYAIFYESLPSPRQALNPMNGVFLCNRGLIFAVPEFHPAYKYMFAAFVLGCIAVYVLHRWAKGRQAKTGLALPVFRISLGILICLPLVTWLTLGAPLTMSMPKLTGLETLRLLKQFKSVLPCILMSARLDELLIEQARLAQAFSVLSKPVTRLEITGVVRQALERTYNWSGRFA